MEDILLLLEDLVRESCRDYVTAELTHIFEDARALHALCLVNPAFNAVFTRKLYTSIELSSKNISVLLHRDKRLYTIKSGNLAHTRNLRILKGSFAQTDENRQEFNDALVDILKHTCKLCSFL